MPNASAGPARSTGPTGAQWAALRPPRPKIVTGLQTRADARDSDAPPRRVTGQAGAWYASTPRLTAAIACLAVDLSSDEAPPESAS